MQDFLRPGDVLIADQGTAFYGAAGLTLPDQAQLIGQPLWGSIGWSLPAALGASLAAPDRRVVLVAGDGAMQQTAPELGTQLSLGLVPVIIVLNNHGYTAERAIHRPDAGYHDIPAWDWTALPVDMSPLMSPVAMRAGTAKELASALDAAGHHAGEGTRSWSRPSSTRTTPRPCSATLPECSPGPDHGRERSGRQDLIHALIVRARQQYAIIRAERTSRCAPPPTRR